MSGSLAGNPLMSGGGVNTAIPLAAGDIGKNVAPPPNLLTTIGQFQGLKLQQQQIQGNQLDIAQHMRQLAYSHIAAGLANGQIKTLDDATNFMAGLENYGVSTAGPLADMANQTRGAADPLAVLKSLAVANSQPPERAVGALAPAPAMLDTGGQIVPTLTPAPGMPGQGVPAPSAPGFARGYTPGEQLNTTTRPATPEEVAASGGKIAPGQMLTVPLTTVPASGGYNPGQGGARVPISGLGAGTYTPPQRPLNQLGKPYQPPGASAPAVAPITGSRLMKGPGGSFMVPPDKVSIFQQNGYQ